MSPAGASADSIGNILHAYLPHNLRNVVSNDFAVRRVQPFLATFGAAALTYYSARAVYLMSKTITKYFLTSSLHLGADLRKSGEWAVITGGSDGIGKEYAFQRDLWISWKDLREKSLQNMQSRQRLLRSIYPKWVHKTFHRCKMN